jgi:bifunctional NMN adenylyltransferase/nudix hydrolase
MDKLRAPSTDVGVIIGRFQVHELHEAHKALINTVIDNHDAVLIFIGLSPLRGTSSDPLDFASRKNMIQEEYPDINIYYIEDTSSDEVWSSSLDRMIEKMTKPHQTVTLYGSRDSFIPHYLGKYPTFELKSEVWISGTEIRRRIANNFKPTKDYRAGVIASTYDRFPGCYVTVDIAVVDKAEAKVIMVQKPDEAGWRFPGGFSTPDGESFEQDARREVAEETSVETDNMTYIGSKVIDDWRYRRSTDKIKTMMFVADYVFGRPTGGDDVKFAKWVSIEDLILGKIQIMPEHEPLVEMFLDYTKKNS